MGDFAGVLIEESLSDKTVLKSLEIINTRVEKVVEKHRTPWLKKWTLHTVKIPANQMEKVADAISKALVVDHNWYADFKDAVTHYIIFRGKIFQVTRANPSQYAAVKQYGVSLGIPDYQLDFSPDIK